MKMVRATVRYEKEAIVTVPIQVDHEDDIGYRDVEDAVYASGVLIDAIDLEVRDYEVVSA